MRTRIRPILICAAAALLLLGAATAQAGTNVSGQVSVTQTGFGRNRATGMWVATMTVTNNGKTAIAGPVHVVLTSLSSNAAMVNNTGTVNNSPDIMATTGSLAAGGSVKVIIQFTNPSNGFINYTPVTYSGAGN